MAWIRGAEGQRVSRHLQPEHMRTHRHQKSHWGGLTLHSPLWEQWGGGLQTWRESTTQARTQTHQPHTSKPSAHEAGSLDPSHYLKVEMH